MNHVTTTKAPDDGIRVRRLAPGYRAPLHTSGERGLASRAHAANVAAALALIVGFAVPAHAAPDCYDKAIRDSGGECEVEVGPRTSTVEAGGTLTIKSRWCDYQCPAVCADRACSGRTSDVTSDVICEPGASCVGAKNANGICTGQDAPAGTYCKNGEIGDLDRAVIRAYPLPGSSSWANDSCPVVPNSCVTQTRTLHWYTPETGETDGKPPADEADGRDDPEPFADVPTEPGSMFRYDKTPAISGEGGRWAFGYRHHGAAIFYSALTTGMRWRDNNWIAFVLADADGELMPCPNNALGHEIVIRWTEPKWHGIQPEMEATIDGVRLSANGLRCVYALSGVALSNVMNIDFANVDVAFGVELEQADQNE